jgi:DNA-binding protein HU-beta
MSSRKIVTDAYQWSYDRYVKDDPELVEFADDVKIKASFAQQIYDIRKRLRMSREELAELAGLTAEAIEDLEETDYEDNWDDAIEKINSAFRKWFQTVILPAAEMTEDDYSVRAMNA